MQTVPNLHKYSDSILQKTTIIIRNDVILLQTWCNLFAASTKSCMCNDYYDSNIEEPDDNISLDDPTKVMEYEIEQSLILHMFEEVVLYFCRVHLSDILDKYKDTVLLKHKSMGIRKTVHSVEKSGKEVESILNKVDYPCGICKKECIDVE